MNFICGSEDDRIDKHVEYMKQPKIWADNIEIIALCGFLNTNIDVYTPTGIIKMSFEDNNQPIKTKTIEICFYNNNHYCSVIKLEDTTISNDIYEQKTTLESLMIDDKQKATPSTRLIGSNRRSPSGNQPSKYEPGTKSQKITTDKAKTSSSIVEDTKLQNIAPQIQKPSKNNSKKLQMTTGKSKAKTKANDKD